ncbi:hypothetical protein ACHAW6_004276 [Cyclotella cf. meneghiniana]
MATTRTLEHAMLSSPPHHHPPLTPWGQIMGRHPSARLLAMHQRSYAYTSSDKVLERASKEKVHKYELACIAQCQDFTQLIYLADGLASKEARKANQ